MIIVIPIFRTEELRLNMPKKGRVLEHLLSTYCGRQAMGDTCKKILQNRNKKERKVGGLGVPHTERTRCSSSLSRKSKYYMIPVKITPLSQDHPGNRAEANLS